MRNIRLLWDNLYDSNTSVKTSSSEASGFPLVNIKNRWHSRCWRSTGVADEWVKVDLGSVQSVQAFVIKNHNFTSGSTVQIQGNATDDWGAPSVNVTMDHHASLMYYFWASAQSYRWWRIRIQDAGNGDGYLKIGRLFLGTYFSPARNFSYVSRKKLIDPSVKRYSSGGQISSNQKEHYRVWSYEFGLLTSAEADTMEDIFDAVGQSKPYFICEDADDAYNTLYYVQNMNDWEMIPVDKIWDYYSLTAEVEEMR